jgi:hypothetical protein
MIAVVMSMVNIELFPDGLKFFRVKMLNRNCRKVLATPVSGNGTLLALKTKDNRRDKRKNNRNGGGYGCS